MKDPSKMLLIESVFAGGGEMGARMRELDWSSTILDPLEQWPQSLRACVRVMLGSGYGFSWLSKSLRCGVFRAFLPSPSWGRAHAPTT